MLSEAACYALCCAEKSVIRRVQKAPLVKPKTLESDILELVVVEHVALFVCFKDLFILLHEFSGRKHMRVYTMWCWHAKMRP